MAKSKSEGWRERDRKVLWHPFTQQQAWEEEDFPVIESAEGVYLVDIEGNRYIDGVSSLWCNVHGHGKKQIDDAIRAQLEKMAHSTFLGLSHPSAIELAEMLFAVSPGGLDRVFFSDDGSTAVEVALKMAFQYWQELGLHQKVKFITCTGGYHGDTLGAVGVSGIDQFHRRFKQLLFQTIRAPTTYAYRCEKTPLLEECGKHCIEEIEGILKTHGHEVAALVIEPLMQGAGGMILQPPGYLTSLRYLCDRYNVLLVADEVMTGFGRTGKMFACEHENVTPDLMAVSKGLSGGTLPIAATLATGKIYDAFLGTVSEQKAFLHGHTFTANPLACAAAIASLKAMQKDRVLEKMRTKVHWFGNALQEFYKIPQVGDIRIIGLAAGIELVRDPTTREPFPPELRMGHRVALEARSRGAIIRPLGDVIVLMPPLAIPMNDFKKLVRIVRESIEAAVR